MGSASGLTWSEARALAFALAGDLIAATGRGVGVVLALEVPAYRVALEALRRTNPDGDWADMNL